MQRTDLEREISVVHQYIDRTQLLLGHPHHRLDLIALRHIGLNEHGSSADIGNFLQHFFGGVFILMIIDNHGSAVLRQANGRSRANAAARAGNERDFSLETAAPDLTCHC